MGTPSDITIVPPPFPLVRVGFDLDGTLDQPEIAALARVLFAAGIEIHVVTVGAVQGQSMGAGDEKKIVTAEDADAMYARKVERLSILDVPFTKLHVVTGETFEEAGEEKAAILNYSEIPIMIDDSPTFVKEMVFATSAMILHLKPGGNDDDEE